MSDDWETFQKSLKRTMFSPASDYENPSNCKMTLVVHRDGSTSQRFALHTATPEQREQLICRHYLRNCVLCFWNEDLGVDHLSRDNPWDFEIRLSNSEHFFVEITSIADSEMQFIADKREERLRELASQPMIRVRDLRKLVQMFHLGPLNAAEAEWAAATPDTMIPNPIPNGDQFLMLGNTAPRDAAIATKMLAAVEAKVAKKHGNKDKTRLIVDCRCRIVDEEDHARIIDDVVPLLADMPFAEIWLYVGYYSDDDGNNAAFTFAPLKLSDEKWSKLAEIAASRAKRPDGAIVF